MNRNILTFLLALLVAAAGHSQITANPYTVHFMTDANGRMVSEMTDMRVEGSPWYSDEYNLAAVTAITGKVYDSIAVKFNVQANELTFKTPDGKEMVAIMPIRRIRFFNIKDDAGTHAAILETVGGQPLNTANAPVYELVDTGHITTLKQIKVTSKDVKEFNEASPLRKYTRKETWYVRLPGDKIEKLESGKEPLLTLLKDKSTEITAYTEKEKLKCRSIDDCRQVIRYYNTLF
ncbi:MAG: hypothetical protein J7621_16595 [Niastella sp.]|nr:hypothetical protein [Niastella sp.]